MDEIYYSVKQVGILLRVHPLTVRRYIKDGKLKAIKMGGNIRISKSSLDNFSEDIQPTSYNIKQAPKISKTNEFNLDDPIFRLRGTGLSIRNLNLG